MTDITPSSAPAGATVDSVKVALSIPVPETAKTPTTDAPAPPQAAAEPAKAAEPDKQAASEDEQPRGDDGKFKPKETANDRKAKIQADIDQLTAAKRAEERRVAQLREEAWRLQKQVRETPVDDLDPASQMRRAVREDRLEQTVGEAQRAIQAAAEAQAAVFRSKVDAARERIPDLDTVLADFARIPLSDAACDLIVESDRAADVAYYLAKNPADATRLNALPPHRQGAEIARIEAKVSQAPQPRRTSNAPPPPPMINGSSSPTSKTPSEMSVEELAKVIYARA